jgi:hypothetical protein
MNKKTSPFDVILHKFNLVEYFRLFLLVSGSCLYYASPLWLIIFFSINVILDYTLGFTMKQVTHKYTFSMILDCSIDCLGNVIMAYFICNKLNGVAGFMIFAFSNIHVIQEWYQNIICSQADIYFKDFTSRFRIVNWYYRNPLVLDIVYGCENIFLVMVLYVIEYDKDYSSCCCFYFGIGLIYLLACTIRSLGAIDCFLKMAEHDAKVKNTQTYQ